MAVLLGVDTEDGREASFDAFYRDEFGRLAGGLRLVCGDAVVAEELAQETFVRAYEAWDRVRVLDRPAGWLYTTGFNLLRRRWRLGRRVASVEPVARLDAPEDVAGRLALDSAIAALPENQRKAVVARYVLGFPTEEAAAMLGLTPGALRAVLHRAVTTLRLQPELQPAGRGTV